jgi:hypothetical protein
VLISFYDRQVKKRERNFVTISTRCEEEEEEEEADEDYR